MGFCAVGVGVEISCHGITIAHSDGARSTLKFLGAAARREPCPPTEMDSTSPRSRSDGPLDNTSEAPPLKRLKVDDTAEELNTPGSASDLSATLPTPPSDSAHNATNETILPPSHSLLGTAPPLQDENGAIIRLMETDVGISEYIAKGVPKISGIIKQRCVLNLVSQDGH